jgi:hypothetical protein
LPIVSRPQSALITLSCVALAAAYLSPQGGAAWVVGVLASVAFSTAAFIWTVVAGYREVGQGGKRRASR